MFRALVVLLVMAAGATFARNASADDVSRPPIEVVEAIIRMHAIIGFSWIDQPLNKIVLIKTRKDLCAIKYLSFRRVGQAEDGAFYAEAELYSRSKGRVRRLHLTQFRFRGFHPLVWGGGKPYFKCGRERFLWSYPTATTLFPGSDASVASTQLEDFSKLNSQDPSLQWFRYEEGRKFVIQ